MAKKRMLKRLALPAPATLEEAADFIAKIGQYQRDVQIIETELNAEIERIKIQAMEKAKVHQEAIKSLFDALYVFAQARRDELTEGGKKKTVSLPTGEFSWRITPPSVSIHDVERFMEYCATHRLGKFIRVKHEPDKEAILKDREEAKGINGVEITQREEFVVKPAEVQLEIARRMGKIKST